MVYHLDKNQCSLVKGGKLQIDFKRKERAGWAWQPQKAKARGLTVGEQPQPFSKTLSQNEKG